MVKKSEGFVKPSWRNLVTVCRGTTSLLLNNPVKVREGVRFDDEKEEARARLYTDGDGSPVIPLKMVYAALLEAGRKVTVSYNGRNVKITGTRGTLLYSMIRIKGGDIKLSPAEWVVDTDLARNPKTGGLNPLSRPRFDGWGFEAQIEYNEKAISREKVRELFDVAGLLCGFGDNRPNSPNKPGPHGQFEVVEAK